MCVECNYCGQVQVFFRLGGILLPLLLEVTTGTGPVDALEVQSSDSNTKVSRPREGP